MRKEKKASDDTLRPHYDLDKLDIVALGPGWSKGTSRSRAQGVEITRRFYASRLARVSPLFSAPRIDKDLLTDFFMIFARTEYALKEAKYFKARSGPPEILWDEFARNIGASLLASDEPAVQKAVKYLTENPPGKQVVKNGVLKFERRTSNRAENDPVFLIRSITTVRNNLFHGGKEIEGHLAERDPRLLVSCLNLLSYAISLDPDVLHFFEELPREIEVA